MRPATERLRRAVLAEPFELFLTVAMVFVSIRVFLASEALSGTVDRDLVASLVIVWQIGVCVGGVATLVGYLARVCLPPLELGAIARARVLEMCGAVILGTSFLVYCIVITWSGRTTNPWLLLGAGVAIAAGFGVTAARLRRENKSVVAQLRILTGDDTVN